MRWCFFSQYREYGFYKYQQEHVPLFQFTSKRTLKVKLLKLLKHRAHHCLIFITTIQKILIENGSDSFQFVI